MRLNPYAEQRPNPIDWNSPSWGEVGSNVHISTTGSDLEAER